MPIDPPLHGTWSLEAFEFSDSGGGVLRPMGEFPRGGLSVDPAGHVCFHFFAGDIAPFAVDDLFAGEAEELARAASGAVVFGGPARSEGDILVIEVTYSLFPNWVGTTQRRRFKIENDRLTLATEAPRVFGGVERSARAVLTRA